MAHTLARLFLEAYKVTGFKPMDGDTVRLERNGIVAIGTIFGDLDWTVYACPLTTFAVASGHVDADCLRGQWERSSMMTVLLEFYGANWARSFMAGFDGFNDGYADNFGAWWHGQRVRKTFIRMKLI